MSEASPLTMSLAEVRDAITSKKISAFEVVSSCLNQLKTIGKEVNAVAGFDEEKAFENAKEADKIIGMGGQGSLLGIPLAHKDMFHRAGRESRYGSKIMAGFIPNETATVLSKLDSEGALDIARLNMVEFALGVTGHNDITGPVYNPWGKKFIAGGSSSGSAAAVAANCVFGALGSDTGGSIRIPCSCCGVVGMKPTWGRVSRFGAMPLSFSQDTIGPITKTVRDNAIFLQAVAGKDENDFSSSRLKVPDYTKELESGVRGMRLAVPENYFVDAISDEIKMLFEDVIKKYEEAGAILINVNIPEIISETNKLANIIISVEGASIHQKRLVEKPEEYGPQTLRRLLNGLVIPATHYLYALKFRKKVLESFCNTVFKSAEAILAPVLTVAAPTIEESDLSSNPGYLELISKLGHCTRPINYMGLPALSIPSGFTHNEIPWGHQIIGKPYDEKNLYIIGRAFEREIS